MKDLIKTIQFWWYLLVRYVPAHFISERGLHVAWVMIQPKDPERGTGQHVAGEVIINGKKEHFEGMYFNFPNYELIIHKFLNWLYPDPNVLYISNLKFHKQVMKLFRQECLDGKRIEILALHKAFKIINNWWD